MAEYSVVEVDETYAFVARSSCNHEMLGDTIADLIGRIIAANPNADMVDAPRVYYTKWEQNACEIEVAIPVVPGSQAMGGVEVKVNPGTDAFTTTFVGPYTGLMEAWMAMWEEVNRLGLDAQGAPWDAYTPPGDDPEQNITDLYIPVVIQKI